MNDLYLIITISGIHFLALISPGPDFIIVLKNSVQYSRKIGIFTSIGISLGIIVHLFYCITGLALILSTNDFILNLFKFLCSGYLIYIGMKSFQTINFTEKFIKKNAKKTTIYKAIRIGFLTNILNPKVSLFFLSLFSLVIIPNELPTYILIILIIIITLSTFIWFSLIAIFLTQKSINIILSKYLRYLNKIFGSMLILIGIRILSSIIYL